MNSLYLKIFLLDSSKYDLLLPISFPYQRTMSITVTMYIVRPEVLADFCFNKSLQVGELD